MPGITILFLYGKHHGMIRQEIVWYNRFIKQLSVSKEIVTIILETKQLWLRVPSQESVG